MRAVGELKRAGEIKAVGCGFNTTDAMESLLDEIDIDYALWRIHTRCSNSLRLGLACPNVLPDNVSVIVGRRLLPDSCDGFCASATYAYRTAPL